MGGSSALLALGKQRHLIKGEQREREARKKELYKEIRTDACARPCKGGREEEAKTAGLVRVHSARGLTAWA